MSKSRKHVHKYHRIELSFGKVWSCALSECTHYMPQYMEATVKGKKTICWKCDEPVAVMDELNWKETHPICESCRAIYNPESFNGAPAVPVVSGTMAPLEISDWIKKLEETRKAKKEAEILKAKNEDTSNQGSGLIPE